MAVNELLRSQVAHQIACIAELKSDIMLHASPFAARERALALTKLDEATLWLREMARVEGVQV